MYNCHVARRRACALLIAAGLAGLAGCSRDGERAWHQADEAWRRRDAHAYRQWRALDGHSAAGQKALARLAEADAGYRRGIARLAAGQPDAREALAAAAALGPMDPALYLPLARACRARGLDERAATLYRTFLGQAPPGRDADDARAELAALGPGIDGWFDEPSTPAATRTSPQWPVAVALLVAAALVAAVVIRARRRRATLAELAAANPELQPAIAYLVDCLRHELLKHRILATGDAARALATGEPLDPDQKSQRQFLLARLYGGEPLPVAWAGHLGAFMRALGPRFDLMRQDPAFIDAGRALSVVAGAEGALTRGDAATSARVAAALERLRGFDAALGALTSRLQHTVVDGALLRELVAEVERELGGRAAIDELRVTPPPPGIAVEIYRLDLGLALKNVLRNAIVAASAGPPPRRVAVDVAVALEPTGEEIVRLCVRDTNPAPLPLPAPLGSGRGLMLTTTALERYDGALVVEPEPAGSGFAKCVVLRLFRALDRAAEAA
jgi:signal transduction histidine kinase